MRTLRKCFWPSAAVLLLLLAGGCTITTEGVQNFEVPLDDVLPPSRAVASYRQLAKPQKLQDAELEEQMGGKENLEIVSKWSKMTAIYSDYGIPERPPKARIAVIEMSSKQNAYGAYSNLRPSTLDEKSYMKIGVHGTVMEDRLLFVQDRYLIMIRDLAGTAEPERRAVLVNFGNTISSRIPRDITDITLVGYLPYEHRVAASEKLDKDDPLSMGLFKSGGVTALYRIETRECTVFLCELKDKNGAKSALKHVRQTIEKEGKVEDQGIGEEGFSCTFRGSPALVSRRESVVFGGYGTFTDKEMKALIANIDRRIRPYVPPKIKEKEKDPAEDAEKKKKVGK